MPTPETFWTYLGAISIYLVVLIAPGALVGVSAGLRGWALAGLSPLLTYTAVGLAGPWLSYTGLPYNVGTAAACTIVLAAGAFGIRRLGKRLGWNSAEPDRPPVEWSRRAQLSVAACVVLATVLSVIVVLSASGGASGIFQRWDTVFHANGIRYIAETGDGGLYGMSTINWYEPGGAQFYPNAYHLVGALVYTLTGASIPAVLNAITLPIAGIFALSMVTMVRQFGGRAVFAGCAAIVAGAATTGAYESVSSGLLPFALGIVLTPLAAVTLQRFLIRPGLDTGTVLALSAVGLLATHSSSLFGAILFAFPLILQRWWRREGRPLHDVLRLLPVMVAGLLLATPQVIAAITFTSGNYPYESWGSDIPVTEALNQLLKFRQILDEPQLWLAALLVVGILRLGALGSMRWLAATAALFSVMFVLVACYGGAPWVIAFSRPWWNDRYRLMALAAIPLCLLAAHGLAEVQRFAAKAAARWSWVQATPRLPARLGLMSALAMVAVLAVVTNGFYTKANVTAVAYAYHDGPQSDTREPPIVADELTAMFVLQGMGVGPTEKVLNDRIDGTAWLYAITGIRPVAGHYDLYVAPRDAQYLAAHFRDYDTDQEVRAAVKRLNVHHVLLGHGAIRANSHPSATCSLSMYTCNGSYNRAPGLLDLDGLDFLRREYANPHAVIYTIIK